LSPRDPAAPTWHFFACYLRLTLAEWESAVESCNRSLAGQPNGWYPLVGLPAAKAWMGRAGEAKEALARLAKIYPDFTVAAWTREEWSDDPTFKVRWARITEGLRKAGAPET